jgi:hypothetical protein
MRVVLTLFGFFLGLFTSRLGSWDVKEQQQIGIRRTPVHSAVPSLNLSDRLPMDFRIHGERHTIFVGHNHNYAPKTVARILSGFPAPQFLPFIT